MDYFYEHESELFTFYRVPKVLFTEEPFKNMNCEAKLLYGLLLDKMGLSYPAPEGAFYIFPCIKGTGMGSEEFCEKLLYSKRVAVVPGNAFGESGEGFVRISYSYSVDHIMEAIKRIGRFLKELGV